MTHLEGPIVDSFYETAIHSWYNKLEPILPCIAEAYQPPPGGYRFGGNNPYFAEIEVIQAAKAARKLLRRETAAHLEHGDSQFEEGFMMQVRRAMERAAAVGGERWDDFVASHTGEDNPLQVLRGRVRAGFASRPTSRRPSMDLIPKMPRKWIQVEILVRADERLPDRRASAPLFAPDHPADMSTIDSDAPSINQQSSTLVDSSELPPTAKSPPKQAFELPSKQIKIEEPPQPARAKPDDASADTASKTTASTMAGRARSGSQRMQALSEKFSEWLFARWDIMILITGPSLDAGALSEAWATVEDSDDLDTFQPHIIHAPHKPFPIAMTSRKPHGSKSGRYISFMCTDDYPCVLVPGHHGEFERLEC